MADNIDNNETNPLLRFDAFMGNVKDGGLRSVTSIYILVSYLVSNLNGKVSRETLLEATNDTMLANYFEMSDAITKLINSGTIKETEDGMLCMKKQDANEVELIEKDLPLTVRERCIKACQKIIARETYERENKVSIEKTDCGYKVILNVSDKDTDFMSLTLFAPTEEQALIIKEKFISDPVKVYETLTEAIFNNE